MAVFRAGVGTHIEAVTISDPHKVSILQLLTYIADWVYIPSTVLSRISVLVLYLRIFTSKRARFLCWIVILFLISLCLSVIIATQVQCFPLRYLWDRSIAQGRCYNQLLWYKLTCLSNVVADVAIILLPVSTIWTIRVSPAREAGTALVCLTGSL